MCRGRGIRGALVALAVVGGATVLSPAAFAAKGEMAVDCDADASGIQTSCSYGAGDTFTAAVHVTQPPSDGYTGFDLRLRWDKDKLEHLPGKLKQEMTWPDCTIPARGPFKEGDSNVLVACVFGPGQLEQDGPSTFTGAIFKPKLRCKGGGESPLALSPAQGKPKDTDFVSTNNTSIYPSVQDASVSCGGGGGGGGQAQPPKTDKACANLKGRKRASCLALQSCKKLKGKQAARCKTPARCLRFKGNEKRTCLDKARHVGAAAVNPTSATPQSSQSSDDDDGVDAWVVVLLVAGGLGAVGLVVWQVRRRRRQG